MGGKASEHAYVLARVRVGHVPFAAPEIGSRME